MDVREKLVELIAQKVCDTWSESCDEWLPHDCGKCYANDCHISEIADHLIINGVTVQEWISVKDRLPEEKGEYIVAFHPCYWDSVNENQTCVGIDTFRGKNAWAKKKFQRVTHWMEKPKPPKGE